jgi:hypothetical protein
MSPSLDQLKETLSSLPSPQRAELAHYLVSSLEAEEEAEWLALAEQRMADVRAGKVVGIPAEEVLKSLLRTQK